MPARRILQLGDPILREISVPVPNAASATGVLIELKETLAEFRRTHGFGRGISAVQIGELSRVIYMDVAGVAYPLVNPQFTYRSDDKFTLWDDCFSFPNLMVHLERHQRVGLRYQTTDGGVHELEADGSLSELIQHEMDHLDGILAVDRALDRYSLATREEWLRRFRA